MSDNLTPLETRLADKRLRVVFAAESGSRAWGFASPDSDYDIRFVFASEVECYLSLFDPTQDIQFQAPGALDFAGWDLKKALVLAQKSNPSLLEWLGSPIIYRDPVGFRSDLSAIMQEHYSPRALAHHYINFMRNIRGKYMADFLGEYTMKRYFYALRPIFCIEWMRANPWKLPPVVFTDVLPVAAPKIQREVEHLLALKAVSREQQDHKSMLLDDLIADWYSRGHDIANDFPARNLPPTVLSQLFRDTLAKLGRP
jgi:predicted nucleotidyltransferase